MRLTFNCRDCGDEALIAANADAIVECDEMPGMWMALLACPHCGDESVYVVSPEQARHIRRVLEGLGSDLVAEFAQTLNRTTDIVGAIQAVGR